MSFLVKGIPLSVPDIDVLNKLKLEVFEKYNKEIFHKMKEGPTDIMVCCPIHNNGQERRPSCGISTVRKGDNPPGTVHCFSCGYVATLNEMISNIFGYDDNGAFGEAWLMNNFLDYEVVERPKFEVSRRNTVAENAAPKFITEAELQKYRFYHPYVQKRKISLDVANFFDVGWDATDDTITFPTKDIDGNVIFVPKRSVKTKYFYLPKEIENKPVYGLWEVNQLQKPLPFVIVCESCFNALTCWVYGRPAVALFGTGTAYQMHQLQDLPTRHLILALDPDNSGEKGVRRIKKYVRNKHITRLLIPDGKDVNDLTLDEFNQLQEVRV